MTEHTDPKSSRFKMLYRGQVDFASLFYRDWLLLGLAVFISWVLVAAPLIHHNMDWLNAGRTLYLQLPSPLEVGLMVLLPAFWFGHTLFLGIPLWRVLRRDYSLPKVLVLMSPVAVMLGLLGFSLYWLPMWFVPQSIVPVLLIPHLLVLLSLSLRKGSK